jgi:hypothetical protein
MKKQILLFFLLLIGLTGIAQTYTMLPADAKPYGNRLFIRSNGEIISGIGSAIFRTINTKQRVDNNTAIKPNQSVRAIQKSISTIRAIAGPLSSNYFVTSDYGKTGKWIYDPSDNSSIDDGILTIVTVNGARIKRLVEGNVQAEWAGLSVDPLADNTAALNKVVTIAKNLNKVLEFPPGNYNLRTIWRAFDIVLKGNNTTLINNRPTSVCIELGSNTSISDIKFNGGYNSEITGTRVSLQVKAGSTNITISKCDFFNCNKTAFIGLNVSNLVLKECNFYDNGANFQLFDGGENITIDKCSFKDAIRPSIGNGANGISLNKNNNGQLYRNVKIVNSYFGNLTRMGIECFNLIDSKIEGNIVENVDDMGMSFPLLRNSSILNNIIRDVGSYAIEIPGQNGHNLIAKNRISNPKDNASLSDAIILSVFANSALVGTIDSKYNRIEDNVFENWQNASGTKSCIKVKGGNNSESVLNDGFTSILRNTFINSSGILFEGSVSSEHIISGNTFTLNSRTKSISRFVSIGGTNCRITYNKINSAGSLIAPRDQCISFSGAKNILISNNVLKLGGMYRYGVRETTSSLGTIMLNNNIKGFVTGSVYQK